MGFTVKIRRSSIRSAAATRVASASSGGTHELGVGDTLLARCFRCGMLQITEPHARHGSSATQLGIRTHPGVRQCCDLGDVPRGADRVSRRGQPADSPPMQNSLTLTRAPERGREVRRIGTAYWQVVIAGALVIRWVSHSATSLSIRWPASWDPLDARAVIATAYWCPSAVRTSPS